MRKTVTLVCFICISFSLYSQLNKGVRQLGGVISFSTEKRENQNPTDDRRSTTVSVNPTIGKFYRDDRLAGVHLIYQQTFTKGNMNEYRALGGGVFLRQYKALGKSGLKIFAQERLSVWFEKFNNTIGSNTVETRTQNVGISVVPALAYGVTKRLQVEFFIPDLASIRFQRSKPDDETLPKSNTITFSTGISQSIFTNVNVGLTWLF